MPLFLCFQSFGISYLEVGLSLSWEVLCLLRKDCIWIFFGFGKIATIRRRGAHIANVLPGPKPRTGFGGGDTKHCLLLWWYAVSADQAFQEVHCKFFGIRIIYANFSRTKLHVRHLIFHSQCIGNGKRRRLVCPPSCRN